MAASNRDDFDGYRKWLGISTKNRIPTHYELLGISLDDDDPDVIQAAAEQRRNFVESKRGEGHDDQVTEIIYRVVEAESTLLNTALRRDYDRKMNLFEKRRKSRQVDPVARRSGRSRGGRTVGEDGGIVKTFAGIVAITCVAFAGMAWFGFRVQPKAAEVGPVAPAPAQVVQVPVSVINAPEQQVTAERKDLLKGIKVKEDTLAGSWTFDGGTLITADNSACNVFLPLPDNESYRLEIEATRTHGNAGLFVNISSFGSFSAVCIDRGVPHKNPLPNTQYSGLANIDGRDAAENPSKTLGTAFQTGKTATIVIEVRPRHISATVDGRSVVDWHGASSRLSGGKPRETGLGTWTNEGRTWRFSKIVLTKLIGPNAESPVDPIAKAKETIQGEWLCVASEEFGKTIDEENVKKQDRRTTISGNDFTMLRTYGGNRGGYVGKFQIDASNGHFDFEGKTPDGRLTKWIGIYVLNGDVLKLCFWDQNLETVVRPTNFQTPCVFHTYRRIAPNDGSDRLVAEWVISKGGNVIVRSSGEPVKVFPQGRLPTGDITLTEVYFVDRKEIVDEDIRRLVGLRRLTTLSVAGTRVTDNAMKHVGEITSLTTLSVASTSINGSGFEHFTKLKALNTLLCGGAPITDASLTHLTRLPNLESLGLIDTQVTDAGMQAIASMDKLKDLRLAGTKVTDDGLNRLTMLKSLEKLLLSRTLVSKKGVVAIRAALPQCEVTE